MNKLCIKIFNASVGIDEFIRKKFNIIFYYIKKRQYVALFEHLDIKPNDYVLDIGFGDSYYVLSKYYHNKRFKFSFASAGSKILKNGKLRFISQETNKSIYVEENKFTTVYTMNTMFFSNEFNKFFPEIIRILKPNGIFINIINIGTYINKILYNKYGYKEYSVEEMKEITKKYGMEIVKIIEIKKNKSYCIISRNKK